MDLKRQFDDEISFMQQNIQYYKQMIAVSRDPYEKMFYEGLLYSQMVRYHQKIWSHYGKIYPPYPNHNVEFSQREFTLQELAQYDGSGGRPAYVAVNGIVYDVSLEATWGGGTHFSLYAGRDLTGEFNGCHEGRLEVLKNLPQIGVLRR